MEQGDLLARADVVVSAVTASQAVAVAREAMPSLRPGTWFVDLNSASPGAKREMSALIEPSAAASSSRSRARLAA